MSAEDVKVCLLLTIGIFGCGIFMIWFTSSPEEKYIMRRVNECSLTKEIPRPDLPKVYCGKACFRKAKEEHYFCKREQKEFIIFN